MNSDIVWNAPAGSTWVISLKHEPVAVRSVMSDEELADIAAKHRLHISAFDIVLVHDVK